VTLGVNVSSAIQNKLASLYVRKAFSVTAGQAASTNRLQLVTRFNDGFIAFVNGVEVARRNMGNPGMFAYRDQTAFNTNVPSAAAITIDLGAASNLLAAGTCFLCVQTHNKAVTSGDFLSMADLRIGGASPVSLVTNNTVWKYFAGVAEPSGGLIDYGLLDGIPQTVTWAALGYNDSAWPEGAGPIGYDTKVPPPYLLGVNLSGQMYGVAGSLYTRTLFSATPAEAGSTEPLQLVIDYDDGIIVYLNGREVARRNVGTANTVTPYNTLASSGHTADGVGETILLGPANTLLAGGDNALGVQTHNSSLTSSDLIGRVTLSTTGDGARTLARPTDTARYFIGTSEPQTAGTGDDEDEGEDIELDEDTPDSESDWIELYNAGAEAVNLTGWSLTDDDGKPRKWSFPAGSSISAGGYLVVMATGFDVGTANGATYLHTNFKLSSDGEYLGLVDASGLIASEIAPAMPAQSYFHTYSRNGAGQFAFSDTATPGAANAGAFFSAITAPPDFSHLGGFQPSAFLLQIAAPAPEAEVRYTLDGSEPSATNALYSAPLSISANTVVRARCFKTGEIPSGMGTYTYLVAQSAAKTSLPAMCFSGSPSLALYGPNSGGGPAAGEGVTAIKGGGYVGDLWNNLGDMNAFNMPLQKGRSCERAVGLEYYPTSGVPLRTRAGLRVSGSNHARPRYKITQPIGSRFSPTGWVDKPSFNFFFRGELGESPEDYAFFPESRVTKFEDMRLRAGKNDVYNPFIRDELARRIFIGTGQEGSRGSFVSIYMNGVWKGYYNFCEHLREAFMQQHHNSIATWDVRQVGEFASGDSVHWNSMISYVRTNNHASAQTYARVADFADIDNIIDYLMVNAYAAMWDWPHNNWVAARERSGAGRWRFYMWDAEGAFGMSSRTTSYNSFTSDLIKSDTSNSSLGAAIFYTHLRASPEFRLRFADRAQKHLFHNGCLTRASMEAQFFTLRDAINPIMQETVSQTVNMTFYNTWIASDTRRGVFFSQLAEQNIWPATLAPEFSQHGGTIAPNTQIVVSNPNGAGNVYWTTNGVDPRALGGAAQGELYAGPLLLASTCTLKARVLSAGGEWSPLQEAFFLVPVDVPAFLPVGSADWTADANWSSAPLPYPNGAGAEVFVNAPVTADRDINLRAPVAVGSVTFQQNDSAFRNRVRDRSSGNTLTFAATNGPAEVVVNGTGKGYVEFEVEADAVLASDLRLRVNNTVGHDEYGALRLRANWRGAGGLVKEGDGVATLTGDLKSYAGPTVVDRGVLAVTAPAAPAGSASLAVNPGGQLRLTSASTDGVPRVYAFGGPLSLDSLGRRGAPAAGGQGVSGGLRYQPETDGSVAAVTNGVVFAGFSGVHVEGSRNALELSGPLSGQAGFVKTGAGNLILSGQSRRYLAPVVVSNGTVTVAGRIQSSVELAPGGRLAGAGRVGPLLGSGTVALDKTVLSAPLAAGPSYAFAFGAAGSPSYGVPGACVNGVLRVLAVEPGPAPSGVDVFLDAPALAAGDRLRGGLFVEGGRGLGAFLDTAVVRYFAPDPDGSQAFAGRNYSPYAGGLALTMTAVPETADFGDGQRQGLVLEVRVAGAPVSYGEWAARFVAVSGDGSAPGALFDPSAASAGSGLPNLMGYAFGVLPGVPASERLPRFGLAGGVPEYRFPFDPGKRDLAYRVEASPDLRDWSRVLFDSREDWPCGWDGETLSLTDPEAGPARVGNQFYRLRVILDPP
jgi:autotransporter-associated beta strand protein